MRQVRSVSFVFIVLVLAGTVSAMEIGPNDFRISDMGTNGASQPQALIPVVAYNSTNDEFLVVWHGQNSNVNEREVYGQRIDASTGAEVGTNDFRISDMGPDGDTAYAISDIAIAYNATNNEYLVVWRGDDNIAPLVDNEHEIFGQRIDAATGAEVGPNDFRISYMGTNGNTTARGEVPWVVWNSTNNEYLVVWRGHHGNNEFEIWGQRLVGATGLPAGGHIRISDAGADGNASIIAIEPKAAHNSTNNEYLVAWQADDLVDNEFEIFGQRLNAATGAEVGTNDFRISDMGVDGDTNYRGQAPAVAYNPRLNEYLVVFYGTDPAFDGAQIIGQRIDAATGAEVGTNDFLISDAGPQPGAGSYNANYPSVAFSAAAERYIVVWGGDDDQGTSDNEVEVWGQLLSSAGAPVGVNDFRLSDMGPDNSTNFAGGDPEVTVSSSGIALVAWRGDDDIAPLVDGENEIFGQLYSMTGTAPVDGDFNSDGKTDLLWRNYSTGQVNVWLLDGTTYLSGVSLFTIADTTWRIEGTGDFNGDGKTDLIWKNYSTGAVNVWLMNGTSYLSGATLFSVPDPNWQIEVVDDFNGDGKDDLIWRNYASGAVNVWFLNGTTYLSGASLFTVADPNWQIEAPGDFDGDGKTDLIWRNYATGEVNVWFLDGGTYLSGASLFTVPNEFWNIEASGDYDGDGDTDLIWRNYQTGEVNAWFLDGTAYVSGESLFTVAGDQWEIAGPR